MEGPDTEAEGGVRLSSAAISDVLGVSEMMECKSANEFDVFSGAGALELDAVLGVLARRTVVDSDLIEAVKPLIDDLSAMLADV